MEEERPAQAPIPKNETIVIPAAGLWSQFTPLCADIQALLDDAEQVSVLNPFLAYWRLRRIDHKRSALHAQCKSAIHECLIRTAQLVEGGPAFILPEMQTWSQSIGLSNLFRLHTLWADLSATVDRKFAYTFASLSMYIAIISLIATVVLGITSLR